ncbi:Actin, larval muscle,Actin, clone 403,Actin-104,Actin, alpha sarcomeric/skeletal,Actin-2, muscle-specific,Actin, cytoskeletal 3A,Beta-actin-like protein 2,Actin, indirect flight muscle,Actin-103,Actin-46,Putative actin-9,Actin-65,Actin, cytoskeletal 1A,Actin-42A,Actin-4,Actin-71,Actin-75,Actin-85C,Putative actin-22,Actin, alpha skeletal muscle 3,Putative actin-28,Actin, cytoskeletal 1B,Actin, muscle-type A2,Actin-8,Major actin,Actin, adductor muscle,Actin CyI, cytoplasmic,Actin, macronuclear,Actin, cytopla|uniref:ACTB_G1 n=1 Tax=Mytilus coruscus TaxID=42192 RepID=A0A6J8B4T2_MYTCO|nr:Actin, larval muscle,Actin, clone 403,Actin-104,Actin, alpha sarcomeric/skeletal,Actin-2, muscle-specific,Actin, cytoskeletal 3A,Beta-actin-like protein 2,Actin, indirect flight muscle,Actin-103,Actin-46,Putative actin-9,Actin-65,Actin, cytoskeletal 1A,Actin-42A,Actin-4,Actin-71,Actin-75,Actin-85C,Putative actin-22,Actin, alpha skeletal muscle 3,Putative actin-28,Actin, cytoskeletal 1B,Actin, muscle-type A2,Actin-8,Major actin,Actin, adductor muscle,Actin CyI, cytoplasmic,Actin, macronuclear,Act
MDEKEEIHRESENVNVYDTDTSSSSLIENKSKKRKFNFSMADNDTDAHHTPKNETAIFLGHQVSQLAEYQIEPSSQFKSSQNPQVPTLVFIQYEGLQCMARVSSMTKLFDVVTERFPKSGNVTLLCEGTVLDDSVCFDLARDFRRVEHAVYRLVVRHVSRICVGIAYGYGRRGVRLLIVLKNMFRLAPCGNSDDDLNFIPMTNFIAAGRTKMDKKPRIEGYVENELPFHNIDDFRYVFRVSMSLFEELVCMIASHTRADDDVAAVVIDNGSCNIKAGFAGDDCHRYVFSTVVGRPGRPAYQVSESEHEEFFVGNEAQRRRSALNLNFPIEHGIITNLDDMEQIWQHCFNDELTVDPAEHPIVMSEPPLNPKGQKERTVQVMFEKFNAAGFFLDLSSKLSIYAPGRGSGINVDVGDGVSNAVTVYEGHSELEIVREMKDKLCYVALDCEQEAGNVRDENFELPDGNTITIGEERFMCPEAFFGPIPGVGSGGIDDLLQSNWDATDIDCKKDLQCNVILSGATTMFPGFPERIRKGIESFVPRTTKVKVIANPERKSSVWIGGSILGSLSTLQTYWITKQEYEEYGPTIVHRRD